MYTFISKEEVLNHLNNEQVRIVDCRFQLGKPEVGQTQYEKSHIPGAVYFHLEKDLSGVKKEHGGRHPLPEIKDFQKTLESVGISNETTVIAYDGGDEAFAARLWWLMKYVGHEKVQILDGGFDKWEEANYPVDEHVPSYTLSNFKVHIQENILATVEDVRDAILHRDSTLIDSREQKRYLGIEEPIDKKAGHIPTAINKAWMHGFENGFFKSPSDQEKRFNELKKDQPIIVYCGSGITATPNYIALQQAGFKNIKLYAGSFSDWVSYDEHEVEIGEEFPK